MVRFVAGSRDNKLICFKPALQPARLPWLVGLCMSGILYSVSGPAYALHFHTHGNRIIASGHFLHDDYRRFNSQLLAAQTSGKKIDTVVMRHSPGGYVWSVPIMTKIVREKGMNTIADGGCYSACAELFVSGVQRQFSEFDLPGVPGYDKTVFGIHGASINGRPYPPDQQGKFYKPMLNYLGNISPEAKKRIVQAHTRLLTSAGFLRYFDIHQNNDTTSFCNTGNRQSTGCISYPGVTALADGILTSPGYAAIEDRLIITGQTIGHDINPHFDKITADDTWGVVILRNNAHWHLSTTSGANHIWAHRQSDLTINQGGRLLSNGWIVLSDNGRLHLNGGSVSGKVHVLEKGTLSGSGTIEEAVKVYKKGRFSPEQIVLTPASLKNHLGYHFSVSTYGKLEMQDHSTLAINIHPATSRPALTLVTAESYGADNTRYIYARRILTSQLDAKASVVFELNAAKGFYPAGGAIPVLAHWRDTASPVAPDDTFCENKWIECKPNVLDESTRPVKNGFRLAASADNPDEKIILAHHDNLIPARKNSLLKFKLVQTDNMISLVAQPVFADTSPFSGEMGTVLRQASQASHSNLEPLLGMLQLSTRAAATSQTPALRGDIALAGQQAGMALSSHIGSLIALHQDSAQRQTMTRSVHNHQSFNADQVVAFNNSTSFARLGGALYKAAAHSNQPAAAVDPDASAPLLKTSTDAPGAAFDRHLSLTGNADNPTSAWARAGASEARLEGHNHVSSRVHASALVLGIDHVLDQQQRILGITAGFGSASLKDSADGSRHINAWDLGAYIEQAYSLGRITATARYTHYRTHGTRVIQAIEGLETPYHSSHSNQGISLSLENSLHLPATGNIIWQPLLPVLDFQYINAASYRESNSGAAALQSHVGSLNSLKLGFGLSMSRLPPVGSAAGAHIVLPYLTLRLYREMLDASPTVSNAFLAAPDMQFGAAGSGVGKMGAAWNAGVNVLVGMRTAFILDYADKYARNYLEHGLSATLRYAF